jgi:hypothetical protein
MGKRIIPKEDWYFEAYTWCATDRDGKQWYPVSYDDDGTAWSMTPKLCGAMDFKNTDAVKRMIKAHLKDPFFQHSYPKVELLKIKVYPKGYFDYLHIMKERSIKRPNISMRTEEVLSLLESYGFKKLSFEECVKEVSRDNGELYKEVLQQHLANVDKSKNLYINYSIYEGDTYLLKTEDDLVTLCEHRRDAKRLAIIYDHENKYFSEITEDVTFPCFAVIKDYSAHVYSVSDTKEAIEQISKILETIE